jgi:hypothetical protein
MISFRLTERAYAYDTLQTHRALWINGLQSKSQSEFKALLEDSIKHGHTVDLPAGTLVTLTGRASGVVCEVWILGLVDGPRYRGKWSLASVHVERAGVPLPPTDEAWLREQFPKGYPY